MKSNRHKSKIISRLGHLFLIAAGTVVGTATTVVSFAAEREWSEEQMRALEQATIATLNLGAAIRPAIDRSTFDRDNLIHRLDFDEAEIIRFVTEDIAFQAYDGVPRGAHGTLLARAGNAVDQSLLLATLLKDAGLDTIIRAGTLSQANGKQLLRTTRAQPPQTAARSLDDEASKALAAWSRSAEAMVKASGNTAQASKDPIEWIHRSIEAQS